MIVDTVSNIGTYLSESDFSKFLRASSSIYALGKAVRNKDYYLKKILASCKVTKVYCYFNPPSEDFYRALYKKVFTCTKRSCNYPLKVFRSIVDIEYHKFLITLDLEDKQKIKSEIIAHHFSAGYSDIFELLLKSSFVLKNPLSFPLKDISGKSIKVLFDSGCLTIKQQKQLLCDLPNCHDEVFYHIVDNTTFLLDKQLRDFITRGKVAMAQYIIGTRRLDNSELLDVAILCCYHSLVSVLRTLNAYDLLPIIPIESIQHAFDTKGRWKDTVLYLLQERKLTITEESVLKFICEGRHALIEMLNNYNMLVMRNYWIGSVMRTHTTSIIVTMINLLDDNVVVSSYMLDSCCNDLEATTALINKGVDNVNFSTLQNIVKYGCAPVLKLVLDSCVYDTKGLDELLLLACKSNKHDMVEVLLQDGRANPSHNNSECLVASSRGVYVSIVKLLLDDYRADPLVDMELPLRNAYKRKDMKMVDLFLWDGRSSHTLTSLAKYV
jgi:hypothetical protein